jgi:hypothetical protein
MKLRTALIATAANFVLITVFAGNVAAFPVGGYVTKTKSFTPTAQGFARGTVSCPTGDVVVAGGAYWYVPGQPLSPSDAYAVFLLANLPSSTTTWLAAGFTAYKGFELAITVQCLPKSTVGIYSIAKTKLARAASTTSSDEIAAGYLACPKGQRVVTGGAGWWSTLQNGFVYADAGASNLSSSSPTLSKDGWYAAGYQLKGGSSDRLEVVVMCRPLSAVGTIAARTFDFDPTHQDLGGYVYCPTGQWVVSLGGFWHRTNQSPDLSAVDRLSLAAAAPTLDRKGAWDAADVYGTADGTFTFTGVVECHAK